MSNRKTRRQFARAGPIGRMQEAAAEFSIGKSSTVRDGKTAKVEPLEENYREYHRKRRYQR
jgi:hypothetical protein